MMNRLLTNAFPLFITSLLLCLCFSAAALAQQQPASAPALPPGMTGSDVNDPRAKLTPGLYDAGESAMGIKHLTLVKKPDAFQLGTDDTDDPRVAKSLGVIGIGDASKIPKPTQ